MRRVTSRRRFLQSSAAIAGGFWVAGGLRAQESRSPNEMIAIACVGVGGKGRSDSTDAENQGRIVALCDIDSKTLGNRSKSLPGVKTYTDYRRMFDEMGESIDAVTVSTTDHMHAPISLQAMRMGKHCFCQKPLTRTVYEARLMGQVAREMKVATQMGNQGTADSSLRRAAALLRAGAIGPVKEVHIWTNRPIWPQGMTERPEQKSVPADLAWDLWLGAAPARPYGDGYHPFKWRGWWDFGSGALGDMGCHLVNAPYMGLDLRSPIAVQAETSGHNRDAFPAWSVVTWEFPANDWRPGLKMIWYDGCATYSPRKAKKGDSKDAAAQEAPPTDVREYFQGPGKAPPPEFFEGRMPQGAWIAVGEKGKQMGTEVFAGGEEKDVQFPQSPGHFEEWIRAIRGGEPAMSNFPDYASQLTETVLLGNLAVWMAPEPGLGQRVEWDATNLAATNVSGLETLIKPEYSPGYTLDA
ncbi:MAG: Gfo/Idh/MocA family protein [Planctomycetota bacterium]